MSESERAAGVERASRHAPLYVVVPLWLGAGLADWVCHRRTSSETTLRLRESVIHAMMLSEGGLPAMIGLFLEVNAGVLLAAVSALVAHELTAILDVAYAVTRRHVTPTEQHVHGFLDVVPLMATTFSRCCWRPSSCGMLPYAEELWRCYRHSFGARSNASGKWSDWTWRSAAVAPI